jgi:hypothetical protein
VTGSVRKGGGAPALPGRRGEAEDARPEVLELLVVVEWSRDSWTRRIERQPVELRAAVVRSVPASGARRWARRIEAQGVQGAAARPS